MAISKIGGLIAVALLVAASRADDWPQFGRNSTRNAVSPEKCPPLVWGFGDPNAKPPRQPKNIRWSSSSLFDSRPLGDPVIVNGMVWISSSRRDPAARGRWTSTLLCLEEKTGKLLYLYASPQHPAGREVDPGMGMGCSPLVEGDRLWTVTNRGEILCLDIGPLRRRTGDPVLLWSLDMQAQLGVYPGAYGDWITLRRCSIAGHGDHLYAVTGNAVDGALGLKTPNAPSLICVEKRTGKVVWSDISPGKDILNTQPSSPLILEGKERTQVIVGQGDGWVRSFDSRNGQPVWKYDTNPKDARFLLTGKGTRNWILATPVLYEGRVYIGNGQFGECGFGPGWLHCIDPTKSGDTSPELVERDGAMKPNPNSAMVWRYGGGREKSGFWRFCRTVSNVAVDRGLVIAPSLDGRIHCLDARTGERQWVLETENEGAFRTSPLIVDGHVYFTDGSDAVRIVALSRRLKVEGLIEMEDGGVRFSSPVFANGSLYLRSGGRLHAIGAK